MMKSPAKRRRAPAFMVGMLAAVILTGLSGTNVRAADDDDDEAFDTKFFRNVLRGLGLRNGNEAGIEYRERSPLVVPPSRNLPPPDTTSVAEKTPAWPTDADVKRAREAKAERRKPRKSIEDESVPETPDQLRRQGTASRPGHRPAGETKDPTAPSTLSELGGKSMFSWRSLWGDKEEYGTFTSEPPRESLTEPPAGYRTPSAAQPYGVGNEKWSPSATNPMDTPNMRGTDR